MLLGCCRCTMSLENSGEEERGAAAAAPGGGTTSGGSSADSHSGGVVKVEAPVLQRRRSSTRRAAEPRSALAGEDAGVGASAPPLLDRTQSADGRQRDVSGDSPVVTQAASAADAASSPPPTRASAGWVLKELRCGVGAMQAATHKAAQRRFPPHILARAAVLMVGVGCYLAAIGVGVSGSGSTRDAAWRGLLLAGWALTGYAIMLVFLKILLPRVVALFRLWWLLTEGDLDERLEDSKRAEKEGVESERSHDRFKLEVSKSKDTRLLYLLEKLRSTTAFFLAFLLWYVIWLVVWRDGRMESGAYATLNRIWGCVVAVLACRLVAIALALNVGTTFNRSQNFVKLHHAVAKQAILAKLAAPSKAQQRRQRWQQAAAGAAAKKAPRRAFADTVRTRDPASSNGLAIDIDPPAPTTTEEDSTTASVSDADATASDNLQSESKYSMPGFSSFLTSRSEFGDMAAKAGFTHHDVAHLTSFVKRTPLVAYVAAPADDEPSESAAPSEAATSLRGSRRMVRVELHTEEEARAYGRAIFANVVPPPRRPWSVAREEDIAAVIKSKSLRALAWSMLDPHETGLAGEEDFANAAAAALKERRNLARSIRDIEHTIAKLVTIFVIMAYLLAFFICLFIIGVDVTGAWLAISGLLLSFTFVFGGWLQNLFEAVVLIFSIHPFDNGDVLQVNGEWLKVYKTGLNVCGFDDSCGRRVYVPTNVLVSSPLVNLSRSAGVWLACTFMVDLGLTEADRIEVQRAAATLMASDPATYASPDSSPPTVVVSEISRGLKLNVTVGYTLAFSEATPGPKARAHSRMCAVVAAKLIELPGVEFTDTHHQLRPVALANGSPTGGRARVLPVAPMAYAEAQDALATVAAAMA